jgi:carboxypeptidase C (cathepsin A)
MNTPPPKPTSDDAASPRSEPRERLVTSHHSLTLADGRVLQYRAQCGTVVIREEASDRDGARDGVKERAELFFVAYTLEGAGGAAAGAAGERPLAFAFNGGPGSSSVWLHLGLLGPQRVATDAFGRTPPPPYGLVDNPASLLAAADLVFIDPIGTGFSRMAEGEKVGEFHDYTRDLHAVGEFIRRYLSDHGRWASPKYLIGESYGTTRACGLALYLQERFQLYLNGLVLISCALDFATLRFDPGNDLPYALFLPGYSAAAWFHGMLPAAMHGQPLETVLAEAEGFVEQAYLPALFKGARLGDGERTALARKLARLTGLPPDYLLRADLRVSLGRFAKQLLRERGHVIGRFDARFTGRDRDDVGELYEADPSHTNLEGAYGAGINHHLRRTLGYDSPLPYELILKLYLSWGWKDFSGRYPNVGDALRRALAANPHLRVLVASGVYDLATPYFATQYVLDHLGLRPEQRGAIRHLRYGGGHMMYIVPEELERLGAELRAFVAPPPAA